MDRRSSRVLLLLAVCLGSAFTGCVGKSGPTSNNGTVQTVSLNPSATLSIDLGATLGFSATAQNSLGQTVATGFQFFSSNTASLNIAANGAACAGSWDPTGTICTPGVPGVAQVTAVASGVSSPPTTVYVHQHIGSITVARIGNPNPDNGCFSQDQTWDYQATAYSTGGTDITTTVGPMEWAPTPANVATVNSNVAGLQPNQVQVTAKNPGQTQLFATVSGVSSTPITYTTCLVSSIMLQIRDSMENSVNINAGGSTAVQATVLDTAGNTVKTPPLTWSTTNPEIATVSNGTVSARQNLGGAGITASCTPPTCNIGVLPGLPIYASNGKLPSGQPGWGEIAVNVTASKTPTYTAWAATTGCGTAQNCTSTMFSVISGANPIAAAATVPFTPNSLMFTPQGTRAYLGSPMGLMFLDLGGSSPTVSTVSSATTPCKVAVCGQVLAISPDGNRVVVADAATQPNQVYIYDNTQPTNAPVDLLISGAIAAAFSPDEMKLFILTNTGTMYVYSKVDALASFSGLGSATDVAFSADGSFAYVAGTPGALSVSGFATCDSANVFNDVTLHATPLAIRPLPNQQLDAKGNWAQPVVAFDPPYVEKFGVKVIQPLLPLNQFTCNGTSAAPDTDFPQTFYNLGLGSFTPLLMQVAGNGTQVIVVAQNVPAVLVLDMTGGTTTAFPLANNPALLAASASPDGSQVFVAACDGVHPDHPDTCNSVHIVNLLAGGDIQEVVFTNINTNDSMCNNLPGSPCLPNLIAIKPQ
ncbi:MAG: hypothetical protein WCC22_17885 [Terriglobales bacterium]